MQVCIGGRGEDMVMQIDRIAKIVSDSRAEIKSCWLGFSFYQPRIA